METEDQKNLPRIVVSRIVFILYFQIISSYLQNRLKEIKKSFQDAWFHGRIFLKGSVGIINIEIYIVIIIILLLFTHSSLKMIIICDVI